MVLQRKLNRLTQRRGDDASYDHRTIQSLIGNLFFYKSGLEKKERRGLVESGSGA